MQRDRLITGMLGVAATLSVVTLAVIATRFAGSEPSGSEHLLRLAAAQYVDGQPIVAGKLAESVDLGPPDPLPAEALAGDAGPPPAPANESAPETSDGVSPSGGADATDAPGDTTETPDGEPDPIRVLQQFLIGMGKVAQSELATDVRQRRQDRMDGVEALRRSAAGGFPPGRAAQGNRALGQTLLRLGRYDEAAGPLTQSIEFDPTAARQLLLQQATARLRSDPPQIDAAMVAIQQLLAMQSIGEAERAAARQLELQVLTAAGRYEDVAQSAAAIRRAAEAETRVDLAPEVESLYQASRLVAGEAIVRRLADRWGVKGYEASRATTHPAADAGTIASDAETVGLAQSAIREFSEVVRTGMPRQIATARLWLGRFVPIAWG